MGCVYLFLSFIFCIIAISVKNIIAETNNTHFGMRKKLFIFLFIIITTEYRIYNNKNTTQINTKTAQTGGFILKERIILFFRKICICRFIVARFRFIRFFGLLRFLGRFVNSFAQFHRFFG